MKTITILIIDDEQSILNVVTAYLQAEGYTVYTSTNGLEALESVRTLNPNLIILDIMLPGMDGITFLQHLRRESDVYVIMLTAKSEEVDKVIGLSVGADDYLTKPFSPRELVARVKAALRRYGQNNLMSDNNNILIFQNLRIDVDARRVWKDEKEISLTAIEFDLLHALAKHKGRVLSREQLIQQVWGHDFYSEDRVVDVHLGHVRKKIEVDPTQPSFIITVRGIGYRFEDGAQ